MEGQEKVKLFREKSLEAIESPESLNDYLRVTSPGVWLVMAAVIILLLGGIIWGIFGRINTTAEMAVAASGGETVCYVPYDELQRIMSQGTVTVEGQTYALRMTDEVNMTIVSEQMNPFIRVRGGLQIGDVTVEVPVDARLDDGVYTGQVITESLQPLALLLQ